jgi:hypothetical protein
MIIRRELQEYLRRRVKTGVVLHPHYHRQLSRRVGINWQHYLKQKENFSSVLNCVGYIDIYRYIDVLKLEITLC